MFEILLPIIFWLFNEPVTQPRNDTDNNYLAAKYSMAIDFSHGITIEPDVKYLMSTPSNLVVSYKYYIQYGENTTIEILVPGEGMKNLPVTFTDLDHTKRESKTTIISDYAKRYRTTTDTIMYLIGESSCSVKPVDITSTKGALCDSFSVLLHSSNREFQVIVNSTIENISSRDLFYPDVEYLPSQIMGLGYNRNNVMKLREVIFGKTSVDSLLQNFDFTGYQQISDEEINSVDMDYLIELREKLRKND